MVKKIIVLGVAMLMCLGVLSGCGEDIATERMKMLAAFEKIAEINSYTETTHTVISTDGVQKIDQKDVIKYQKKDGDLIAEGYSMMNNEIARYIYIKDNYKYAKLASAETGVKFLYKDKIISDSISEPIVFLSDEFKQKALDLTVKITKDNTTIYSFKFIEDEIKVSDYKITTETSSNKLIAIKTDWYNTANLSTTTSCTVTYDYTDVIVILPDNLDSYEVII